MQIINITRLVCSLYFHIIYLVCLPYVGPHELPSFMSLENEELVDELSRLFV